MRTLAVLAVVFVAWPLTARADDPEATGGTGISYRHKNQVGLYAQFGVGYRLLVRHGETGYCGTTGSSLCTGTTPPWIELGLSFGVSNRVELITDMRLGLGNDFVAEGATGPAPTAFVVSPGIKIYLDDKGSLKWFMTVQVAFDLTDYSTNGIDRGVDVALRHVFGLQVDVHRTFGFYFHVGATYGAMRWYRFEVDGGLGLQARFP